MQNPSTRRIVVRTRSGWRDIPVETRIITKPPRKRLREDEPLERLVERGDELVGLIAGDYGRFRLIVRDDGPRTWVAT
ncbi:MAG TPA: hypothetical protein VHL31_26425 [Geminicoccus sp.]|jgi:hypothetical protein|uniref:hypothetical protein n=1 Tax=Geminicoccus sp. TaxID=2024832 RepID=UPI002E361269|nr:hypothetical protein [Geminicoccus sp.]HEX2529814.1 hypothetical protein [Geminicoccus sp.]